MDLVWASVSAAFVGKPLIISKIDRLSGQWAAQMMRLGVSLSNIGALFQPLASRYPHSPLEDLCLGLLVAPLLRAGSFCFSHCSSTHRLRPFPSAPPPRLRDKKQRAIWKSPLVSTLQPIFPSS